MKLSYRIILGIAFACIGIGIVVGMLGFAIHRGNYRSSGKNHSTFSNTVTGVESIDLDVQYSKVEFVHGNEFSIEANNIPENGFKSFVKDGVWYLEDHYEEDQIVTIFGFDIPIYQGFFNWDISGDDTPSVIVTIPKDFIAKKVTIEIDAGQLDMDELEAVTCDIKVGAGSMTVRQLKILEEASLEVGAGDIEVSNLETQDADLNCGLGRIDIAGEIYGDLNADCGMGEILLDLAGDEEDYNYYISVGLGDISLNDKQYNFNVDKTIKHDNTIGTFDLNCGLGSLSIDIR